MASAWNKIVIGGAVVAVAGAVWLAQRQDRDTVERFNAIRPLQDLAIGETSRIELTRGGETLTLAKTEGGAWGVAERGGYPADPERLRRFALSVASLEAVDRLTDKPAKYPALGVGDEPANGRIRFLGEAEAELATVYLGEQREAAGSQGGFAPPRGQFVRVAGDPAVYATKEVLRLDLSPTAWLRRQIVDVAEASLQRIEIGPEDDPNAVLLARGEGSPEFALQPPPGAGQTLDANGMRRATSALAAVSLQDVLAEDDPGAKEIAFAGRFLALTGGGVEYRVVPGTAGDKYYARFTASYREPPAQPAEAGASGDADAEDGESEDPPAAAEQTPEDPAEVARQAQKFAERHAGWIYEISEFNYGKFTLERGDLLQEPAE